MFKLTKENLIVLLFAFVFIILGSFFTLYALFLDHQSWVPINTLPFKVGDDYHYFSILKMFIYGDFSEIPNVEFSRTVLYVVNMPVYYLGSSLLDTRFGILFVQLFNLLCLYYAIYYFFTAINKINGWNQKISLIIFTIFVVFFGFHGLQYFFSSYDWSFIINNNIFSYLENNMHIYNRGSISDLDRAFNSSTVSFIVLFVFGYILKNNTNLFQNTFILVVLVFTNVASAIVFGILTVLFEIYRNESIKKVVFNGFILATLGILLLLVQKKLFIESTITVQEVVDFSITFNIVFKYFSAPIASLIIIILFHKYFSKKTLIVIFILSLFQPIAFSLGGHWTRLWIRGPIIPFITIFSYVSIYLFIMYGNKFFVKLVYKEKVGYFIFGIFLFYFSYFSYNNTLFLLENNSNYIHDQKKLKIVLNDDYKGLIITNSPSLALLIDLYSKNSRPLMKHYTLQQDSYIENFKRTILNFELLGISQKKFLENIKSDSPKRLWVRKRKNIFREKSLLEQFYFDEILFSSTYASYNNQMKKDNVLSLKRVLNDSFYKLDFNTSKQFEEIQDKKQIFLMDMDFPFFIIQNR